MGADGSDGSTRLTCCYPFYEGDATIALYIVKMVPFGAFWPLRSGEEFTVTYRISNHKYENYHDASLVWNQRYYQENTSTSGAIKCTAGGTHQAEVGCTGSLLCRQNRRRRSKPSGRLCVKLSSAGWSAT